MWHRCVSLQPCAGVSCMSVGDLWMQGGREVEGDKTQIKLRWEEASKPGDKRQKTNDNNNNRNKRTNPYCSHPFFSTHRFSFDINVVYFLYKWISMDLLSVSVPTPSTHMPHSSSPLLKACQFFFSLFVEVVDCGWSLVTVVETMCGGGSGSRSVVSSLVDPLSLGRGRCGQWLGMLTANLRSDNEPFYWQRYWKHSDDDATPQCCETSILVPASIADERAWEVVSQQYRNGTEHHAQCSSCIISFPFFKR